MIDIPLRRRTAEAVQSPEPAAGNGADRAHERPEDRQDLPPREPPFFRKRQESPPSPESIVGHASSVMQRVAVTSVAEIDSLISELERLRDFLRQESVRIQREIEGYARLSEEATKSTKIIAESVAQWKNALESIAGRRT
jgi:hypothetical protein